LFDVGGCMEGRLLADADFTLNPSCTDPWLGNAGAVVQGYLVGEPRGGANQARIKVVAVVPPANAAELLADQVYFGVRLRFPARPVCAGCASQACLVLNSILVKRLPGLPDVMIETPSPGPGNRVTWEGTGADCSAVPVARHSWGRLKAMYR
jgi:hypothetical protein